MIKRIRISSTFEQLPRKIRRWSSIWNKTDSEFILIWVAMWAKHNNLKYKLSRETAQEQVPTTAFIDEERICFLKLIFYHKILPDCNPNNQENSHKLQIRTTSSKIRTMNFHLEIKLTVNFSWFWLYEPNINNLESKWSREIAQAQVPTTAFIDGRKICFLK